MARTDKLLVLFQPEARVKWPAEWPGEFGAVVAFEKGSSVLGVLAFHPREKPGDVAARAAKAMGLPLHATPVHPPVAGLTLAELGREEEARMRDALSAALAHDGTLSEDADDFAVNFNFAVSENLPLHEHLLPIGETPDPAPAKTPEPFPLIPNPQAPAASRDVPPGFLPLMEIEAKQFHVPAWISRFELGQGFLRFQEGALQGRQTQPSDWFVSHEGDRYAIRLSRVTQNEAMPAGLILPFQPEGATDKPAKAEVTTGGGWLYLHTAKAAPEQKVPAPSSPRPMELLMNVLFHVAAVALVIGVLIAVFQERQGPNDPIEAIRKGLFDTPSSTVLPLRPGVAGAP